ncbi:MAG: ROK family protein [Acidimicrobiales bacterium]
MPTVVDNDAKALTLAEGWLGAARGERHFVGMVVSTGVGGGIVCDGRLLDGADGNAGHIGHVIVEPDGHECGCGARGCLEAEASGTAIARITGRPAAAATAEVIERTGTLVGRAVASVANLLDLRLAVVAGSVALGFGGPSSPPPRPRSTPGLLDHAVGTVIRPAGLGAGAPLVAAARSAGPTSATTCSPDSDPPGGRSVPGATTVSWLGGRDVGPSRGPDELGGVRRAAGWVGPIGGRGATTVSWLGGRASGRLVGPTSSAASDGRGAGWGRSIVARRGRRR